MKHHRQGEQQPLSSVLQPSPVYLTNLREHFRDKYGLTETQVEVMLVSSSQSLTLGLSQLAGVISQNESIEKLHGIYHGLRGLLLNMGATEWAEYIREIECKVLSKEELDHRHIVSMLQDGMADILGCRTTNTGS